MTHHVEIDSPDGYVPVGEFVDKGMWEEYVVEVDGKIVIVNESHLFQTTLGWVSAKEMLYASYNDVFYHVLTDKKQWVKVSSVKKTNRVVPIVDIQVDHPNHRYYANGISSHNTNVGKSIFLCSHAAAVLRMGKNVLYLTMEMAEERIAERIDCNLMDVTTDELARLSKEKFHSKLDHLHSKTNGKLIIKEYPTSGAHVGHFKALLDELKLKRGFIPDIICVDYLNICLSERLKGAAGSGANSYTIIKAVAEELRGMAMQYDVPILTATQSNKSSWNASDIEASDTSESSGTVMTLDFMVAMIRTEELDKIGQVMVKQLKSRYARTDVFKRFVLGIDINKFRLFDVEQPQKPLADSGTQNDKPAFDNSKFGGRLRGEKQESAFDELDFS